MLDELLEGITGILSGDPQFLSFYGKDLESGTSPGHPWELPGAQGTSFWEESSEPSPRCNSSEAIISLGRVRE